MIITNKRRFEKEINTSEEFLEIQQFYDKTIIRLPKEIEQWFKKNINETFARGQLHPQKIRKLVYSSKKWFESAKVSNLHPKFYYMKGYNPDEIKLKIKEMKEKNSKGVKKSFDGLSDEEKSKRCDSSSKEFFQKKFGDDWKQHYEDELNMRIPSRIVFWTNKGYTVDEAKNKIKKIQSTRSNKMWTKRHNGEITTPFSNQIEYYLERGMSKEEATIALKERQATFSKEKLIKKYGDKEGIKIFNERQKKWQETLNSKSDEEKIKISKKKGTDRKGIPHMGAISENYLTRYPEKANSDASLYYLRFFNDEIEFWKIGITTRKVNERFGSRSSCRSKYGLDYEIIFESKDTLKICHSLEQKILNKYNNDRITIDINTFRSTECFNVDIIEGIKNEIV